MGAVFASLELVDPLDCAIKQGNQLDALLQYPVSDTPGSISGMFAGVPVNHTF